MSSILLKDSASSPNVAVRKDYKPKKRNLTHIHFYVVHPLSAHDSTSNLKWVNGWFFLAGGGQKWGKSGAATLLPKTTADDAESRRRPAFAVLPMAVRQEEMCVHPASVALRP